MNYGLKFTTWSCYGFNSRAERWGAGTLLWPLCSPEALQDLASVVSHFWAAHYRELKRPAAAHGPPCCLLVAIIVAQDRQQKRWTGAAVLVVSVALKEFRKSVSTCVR